MWWWIRRRDRERERAGSRRAVEAYVIERVLFVSGILLVWGCGGSVVEGGEAGAAGASAGSGGATGNGGSGAGGTTTAGAAGVAGAGGSPAASCPTVCEKLVQSGCYTGSSCTKDCENGRDEAVKAGCALQYDAMLGCLMGALVSCDAQGELKIAGCDDAQVAAKKCLQPPPDQCASMPFPVGGTQCGGTSDPNGSCSFECTDANQHHWSSKCSGGTCTCSYEGQEMCKCAGSCDVFCCPGTY
jgi:hypothetical protein